MYKNIIKLLKILSIVVLLLISVAYFTIAERKEMRNSLKKKLMTIYVNLKNYLNKFELLVPMLILLISVLFLVIYNSINNPYNVLVQNLVFISVSIINLIIFNFYQTEKKLSFMFFFQLFNNIYIC